jgi:hypothetical protein
MPEDMERPDENEFLGARPRILVTDARNPEFGRTFVWTKLGWFKREEGKMGDVAFTPIADSEDELRRLVMREDPAADLIAASGEYRKMVSAEFMDQEPLNPDSPDNYSEDEFEE